MLAGSAYTTYFRMLDVRLGRWFSPDPIRQPDQSSYCSMDNDPINMIDPEGASSQDFGKAKYGNRNYVPRETGGSNTPPTQNGIIAGMFNGVVLNGIRNVFNGRPWDAQHKTNLVKRDNTTDWAYLTHHDRIITQTYLNNLQNQIARDIATGDRSGRLAQRRRLLTKITGDINFDLDVEKNEIDVRSHHLPQEVGVDALRTNSTYVQPNSLLTFEEDGRVFAARTRPAIGVVITNIAVNEKDIIKVVAQRIIPMFMNARIARTSVVGSGNTMAAFFVNYPPSSYNIQVRINR